MSRLQFSSLPAAARQFPTYGRCVVEIARLLHSLLETLRRLSPPPPGLRHHHRDNADDLRFRCKAEGSRPSAGQDRYRACDRCRGPEDVRASRRLSWVTLRAGGKTAPVILVAFCSGAGAACRGEAEMRQSCKFANRRNNRACPPSSHRGLSLGEPAQGRGAGFGAWPYAGASDMPGALPPVAANRFRLKPCRC
jgi:hypothetical protein